MGGVCLYGRGIACTYLFCTSQYSNISMNKAHVHFPDPRILFKGLAVPLPALHHKGSWRKWGDLLGGLAEQWGSEALCLAGNPTLILCIPARREKGEKPALPWHNPTERHRCHPRRGHGPVQILGLLVLKTRRGHVQGSGEIWGKV